MSDQGQEANELKKHMEEHVLCGQVKMIDPIIPPQCCKCAAYREIIADQAARLQRYRRFAEDSQRWTGWAVNPLKELLKDMP